MDFWTPIVSAVASIVCVAIYNLLVNRYLNEKLEFYKISYSGVFKEKLEIYKDLLNSIDDLKVKVVAYGHAGDDAIESAEKVRISLLEFNKAYNNGSIFYNDKMKSKFKTIEKSLQEVYDLSFQRFFYQKIDKENPKFEQYLDQLTKLTKSTEFNNLKNDLIQDIRTDLGIK